MKPITFVVCLFVLLFGAVVLAGQARLASRIDHAISALVQP